MTKEIIKKLTEEAGIKKKKTERKTATAIIKATGKTFDDFLKQNPVFYDEHLLWWEWNKIGFCWQITDGVNILNLVEDFFNLPTEKISTLGGWLLKVIQQKSRRIKPLKLPMYCLQFKNRIYDLKNEQEFEVTPKYFSVAPIPYELSESSETPTIDKLFFEWVGDKYKKTLYEILAYCCLREQFLQTFFALTGAGSNGKGTYQNLIRKFLGKNNCVSSSIKSLITRSFETSALYKKLVCLVGEVDSSDLSNANLIKQLTGEDLIRYEFKGKTCFSETSPTTFLIATNSLPITPDKSDGFYRRVLVIDFPNQFAIKRDLLDEIPEQEFCNLTRKVVNCLLQLLEKNEFTNGGTILERSRRYEERSNPLMMFISRRFYEGGTDCIKLRHFAKSFNLFLQEKKLRQTTISKIGKLLRDEGFEISTRKYKDDTGEIVDSAKSIIGLRNKKFSKQCIDENSGLGGNSNPKTTQTTKTHYTLPMENNDNLNISYEKV